LDTPPVSTALPSIAFCQTGGSGVSHDARVTGAGASTVVELAAACSGLRSLPHAGAATVRTETATAPTQPRTALDTIPEASPVSAWFVDPGVGDVVTSHRPRFRMIIPWKHFGHATAAA
jgi:hypothetical protein